MVHKANTLELLQAKDNYNRITLHKAWTHNKHNGEGIKADRLRMNYGDLRIDDKVEKRKFNSEGLKICGL